MHRTAPVRVIAACIVGFMAAITLAAPAIADKPSSNQIDEAFPEEVCGLPLTTHVVGTVKASSGKVQIHLTVSWSNATGDAIVIQIRNMIKELGSVDHGDGTWTFTYANVGQRDKIRVGNQTVFLEAGRLVYQDTIFLGDLTTDADDVFLGSEILTISGPRTEDETLLCQVVMQELG